MSSRLRQGDALSTILFNLLLEAALLKVDVRGNISTRTKQLCAYADDVVIIARTKKSLKESFIIRTTKKSRKTGSHNKHKQNEIHAVDQENKPNKTRH